MNDFQGFRAGRLPILDVAELNADQRAYYDAIISRSRGGLNGPMNISVRSPLFATIRNAVSDFLTSPQGGVPPRIQELAILVNARFWNADYEWWAHAPKAIALGVPRSAVEDIRARRTPRDLSADDQVIWEFLHKLMNERSVSDELYERAKAVMGEIPLIHLLGLVGHYSVLALIMNATETHTPGIPEDELEILYPE